MSGLIDSLRHLPISGELLSIGAALFWAAAIVIFRIVGRDVHPLAVNLFKNLLGVALLVPTIAALGHPILPALPVRDYAVFLLSGVIGIAVADTLILMALNKLGAELLAIVDCAYSPFVIGLSFVFLGERMDALQTVGVVLIVLAVLLISGGRGEARTSRRDLFLGIGLGIVSVFLMAAGIVMVKPLLGRTPLLWGTMIRLAGGSAAVGLYLAFHPRRKAYLRPLGSLRTLVLLVPGALCATYFSNTLWLAGMRLTQASIASALNQLSTIFIFVLAALFLKEKPTPRKILAVALAFIGAVLVSAAL
ncbi:MAG: DMT family transporter [Candidatus Aminicenantes bacterium]|nr:DMT family transporter [Candidatus Aminicenantes bacterium]